MSSVQSEKGINIKLDRLRPGQRLALETILARVTAGESRTSIILPTRYGKSDLIRLAAVLTKQAGASAGSLCLSPSDVLRRQLVRADKVDQMIVRYSLEAASRQMRLMQNAFEHMPFSNGEYLLSTTIQLATRNIDGFCQIVDEARHRTGNPLLIHIDECHETSENKRRGELVQRLEAAGALIILYTATAVRADGELIPGFRVRVVSSEDVKRYVTTEIDEETNRVDLYEGERRVVELLADHSTTFKQAWNEEPSPLCNLSREVIDVRLKDISEGEEDVLLSTCTPSKARQYLSKAVRHPDVVDRAVELFLHALAVRQRVNPDAAGIVFSCNDVSHSEANQHAKAIAAAIAAIRPEYQCCIVTMKSDEGDEKSSAQIERFVGVDGSHGKGDVLIVKHMGGAGLDAPRIKVLLDLSPTRTVASIIQRLMRPATPWGQMTTASVITLADPLMDAIWRKHVIEEGGEAPTSAVDCDMEWKKYWEKPKEPWEQVLMEVVGPEMHSFDDNLGQVGDVANLAIVNDLLFRLPELSNTYTKAQLSDRLTGFVMPDVPVSRSKCLDDIIARKQAEIYQRVKQSAMPYSGPGDHAFVERFRSTMNRAKVAAGVPLDVELAAIVNTSTLDVMMNFLAR